MANILGDSMGCLPAKHRSVALRNPLGIESPAENDMLSHLQLHKILQLAKNKKPPRSSR